MFKRFASTSTGRLQPTIRQVLVLKPTNENIYVNGWVKSVRLQKRVAFAMIQDGTSAQSLQAVFTNPSLASGLTNGASVRLTGRLSESPGAGQEKELQVESLDILGTCDPAKYPIQKQTMSVDYLRDHAHLRPRTDATGSMLRLRDQTMRSLHDYFNRNDFCYAHTPIITSSDAEGAGSTFRIAPITTEPPPHPHEFFSQPAYLTVSSQLHLEALANAVSRVWTLSPCFRAERSQTNRHLAEFWMLEAEWAFTRDVHDLCQVVEDSLKDVLRSDSPDRQALWKNGDASKRAMLDAALNETWTRMSYSDAVRELQRHDTTAPGEFKFKPEWGKGLQSEHERWLSEKLVGGPVFVVDYPAEIKPFYMRLNEDGRTAACFDLLVPHVGELVGGSLREERLDMLEQSFEKHRLDRAAYGWYLDLRKYGGAPHGGFGMGFERLISWIGGIENVRECIPMPRWAGRMLL
ncbi:hypothetical protein EW146_g9043 [Bondarzewia mesenterica]|uniref:Asparagine--tRNA ligase, mitochondrial n=1 Tax=Bondarzewia mesenterica TaxID=1095465 RepID=A0A4S4LEY4_9AGAM|nr:hypothetical protein EW146_g9043 [Bondarzewia mesenterica]